MFCMLDYQACSQGGVFQGKSSFIYCLSHRFSFTADSQPSTGSRARRLVFKRREHKPPLFFIASTLDSFGNQFHITMTLTREHSHGAPCNLGAPNKRWLTGCAAYDPHYQAQHGNQRATYSTRHGFMSCWANTFRHASRAKRSMTHM